MGPMSCPDAAASSSAGLTRVTRSKRGLPTEPTPWVMIGFAKVFAWDPRGNLLSLPNLGSPNEAQIGLTALAPNGRLLTYEKYPQAIGARPSAVTYDVVSGEIREEERPRTLLVPGVHGLSLRVQMLDRRDDEWQASGYTVCRNDVAQNLAINDRFGFNFSGLSAQFSPQADRVAITHSYPRQVQKSVTITNLLTGSVERYEDCSLHGSSPWTPDGDRLLVVRQGRPDPVVLNLRSSQFESFEVGERPISKYDGLPTIAGWTDNETLLTHKHVGSRVEVAKFSPASGDYSPVLDIPGPGSQAEFLGLFIAPEVVWRDPTKAWPAAIG